MESLKKHEQFEMEVLEKLKKANFLSPLVFAGGTMLRLCYELDRYSGGLDFWFIKNVKQKTYFRRLKDYLNRSYELTDSWIKLNTLLLEIRSSKFPKRLKIEIRKKTGKCDFEERIAFSKYATVQVILKVHTLEQMMKNKIEAALERRDIRDFYDLEFLLKHGLSFGGSKEKLEKLKTIALGFKENEFKVTLGSVLDAETRKYYIKNKFEYLLRKIDSAIQ